MQLIKPKSIFSVSGKTGKTKNKKEKKKKPTVTRQDNAFALVKTVEKKSDQMYSVASQKTPGKTYDVSHFGHKFGCSCPDFLCRNVEAYKHIYPVKLFIESNKNEEAEEEKTRTSTTTNTTTTMAKKFDNFSQMNRWLNNPLNAKLYKFGAIDWIENTVKLQGRPI
jgi:hypothetical protein